MFPIETSDFIVADECHRSIYDRWPQILEYFNAFLIGLIATLGKQVIGFFNKNLVSEYPHERAVADGVNVSYAVYRIKTQVTEQDCTIEKNVFVDRRDKKRKIPLGRAGRGRSIRRERARSLRHDKRSDLHRLASIPRRAPTALPEPESRREDPHFCKGDSRAEGVVQSAAESRIRHVKSEQPTEC
jgi:superfamily II DNA or RNA helicase